MIYSLCDISAKAEATSKTTINIQTMDMQMQLLRYFRDYGLDNDSIGTSPSGLFWNLNGRTAAFR